MQENRRRLWLELVASRKLTTVSLKLSALQQDKKRRTFIISHDITSFKGTFHRDIIYSDPNGKVCARTHTHTHRAWYTSSTQTHLPNKYKTFKMPSHRRRKHSRNICCHFKSNGIEREMTFALADTHGRGMHFFYWFWKMLMCKSFESFFRISNVEFTIPAGNGNGTIWPDWIDKIYGRSRRWFNFCYRIWNVTNSWVFSPSLINIRNRK